MSSAIAPQPFKQRKRLQVFQVLAAATAVVLIFSRPSWDEASSIHEGLELIGVALVLACIFGRLWSILYVGGRKNKEVVTSGPYSITRNPLYVSSTLGAVGVGLMFGSIIIAATLGTVTYLVLRYTALKEEAYLSATFGNVYKEYAQRVPLFWPNFKLYSDQSDATFSPMVLRKTFIDTIAFLAVFPLIEGIEYLQTSGLLPTLFWIV